MLPSDLVFNKPSFFYYDFVTYNSDSTCMSKPHYHNYYEIYYLKKGSSSILIDDKIFNLQPNDLVLLPSGVMHKTMYFGHTNQRIVIAFTQDYIPSHLNNVLEDIWNIPAFRITNQELVKKLFDNISREVNDDNEISKELLKCYLTELLIHVARNKKNFISEQTNSSSPIIRSMDYILEHYDSNITLEFLADFSGYTKNYFSKIFKDVIGIGYKEYIILTRLKVAEKLLKTTNKSIREIATECGFNDSNYFSTVFQRKYGIAPTNYRKKQITLSNGVIYDY